MTADEKVGIQILSDLHLEKPVGYDLFEIQPAASILALIGDIGQANDSRFYDFLRVQLRNFRKVIFLLGNHEPYELTWDETKAKLREFQASINQNNDPATGKFYFLNRTRLDLSPEVTVLGCTLYSHVTLDQFENIRSGLNDFHYIKDWTVENHNKAHAEDLNWLNAEVEKMASVEPHREVLIITHYSPTLDMRTRNPAHASSKISSGFMTDLSSEKCWTSPNVKVWAYGHTHYNCDFVDESTGNRVVSNQRGHYFSQAKNFDMEKAIYV